MEPNTERSRVAERVFFFVLGAIIALASLHFFGTASAQVYSGSNSNSNASSSSQSGSVANSQQAQQQGNAQSITFNSQTERRTRLDTNTAVPLAAAVSFSSDYCGGVGSAGASAAGVSLGVAKPILDGNCQSLRRAEKFGMMAVTARNMGNESQADALLAMSIWELCTSEGNSSHAAGSRRGRAGIPSTQASCLSVGLVKPGHVPADPAIPAQQKADAERAQGAVDSTTAAPTATTTNATAAVANAIRSARPGGN